MKVKELIDDFSIYEGDEEVGLVIQAPTGDQYLFEPQQVFCCNYGDKPAILCMLSMIEAKKARRVL